MNLEFTITLSSEKDLSERTIVNVASRIRGLVGHDPQILSVFHSCKVDSGTVVSEPAWNLSDFEPRDENTGPDKQSGTVVEILGERPPEDSRRHWTPESWKKWLEQQMEEPDYDYGCHRM